MALTSLFPTQGLQSFVDETTNVLLASSSMSSGQLGGSGQFRSSVTNRASIPDISQNLKASLGIDRIPIQQIYSLQGEFGSNGESVWAVLNDDRGLIRLVGQWSSVTLANNNGLAVGTAGNITDYLEVTFYGTGLNILTNDRTAQSFVASVDGATEGSNFMPSPLSVLSARGYACNQPINVVAGLSLGIHTVKIRNNNASVSGYVYGVEVLNESSGIVANSGSAYVNGKRNYTASQIIGSYNSGFTNVFGTANVRGGHVLVYQDVDGVVKRDIQYVNAASATLTSADHTNEEIVRVYNWREFGANRSDDFSTLVSSSNRAFTLDDGVTGLTGNSVVQTTTSNQDLVYITAAGTAYITLTFVGTGLDITAATHNASTGNSPNESIIIDGVTVTTTQFALLPTVQRFKICSGLTYGTHTVRIAVQSGGSGVTGDLAIRSFITYQPKKPSLPVGAIELADYNLVATYAASTTLNQYGGDPSTGTIVKSISREVVYTGTWSPGIQVQTPASTGWASRSNLTGDFVEYTFFGSGVEVLANWGSAASSATVQIDGVAYTGAAVATGSGNTWTPGTSTWNISTGTSNGSALQITGLSLGSHKIRLTNQASTNGFTIVGFGILMPVHSAKTNLYGDLQSTLSVGSQGVSDNRQNQPLKLQSAQKAWVQVIGVTSSPTNSSTSYVPMPDMSCVVKTGSGRLRVSFTCPLVNASGTTSIAILVDGVQAGPDFQMGTSGVDVALPGICEVLVSAGAHKIDLYWKTSSGTITALNVSRILLVEEI